MAFASGQKLTAARLNRLQPVSYDATATGDLVLTTSQQDVPGASITLTTLTAGAIFVAHGDFDCDQSNATACDVFGRLVVDGATDTRLCSCGGAATTTRASIGRTWRGTLPAAGSHTIKLAARQSVASPAQWTVLQTSTGLTVTIYEVVS